MLVLCPKKFKDSWITYNSNVVNNLIASDKLRYDVLFHTDLSRTRGVSETGLPLDRINWGNYDLVVIDESHIIWRCMACGHEWEMTVHDRQLRMNNRCPACGKVMGSLAWKYPQLAAEWSPGNPVSPWNIKPFSGLHFIPEWACSKNPEHKWRMTTATRINKGRGCPYCEA